MEDRDEVSIRQRVMASLWLSAAASDTIYSISGAARNHGGVCVNVNKNIRMESRSNHARRDGGLLQDEMLT